MSRPGLGPAARRRPPPPADRYPSDYTETTESAQEKARKAVRQAAIDVGLANERISGKQSEPHPFETGQAKEKTSWAPNTKVLAGPAIGTPLAGVLIWVLGQFGVDMPWDVALYFAGLIILLVAYIVPEKKS